MTLEWVYMGFSLLLTAILIAMGNVAIKRTFKDRQQVRKKRLLLLIAMLLWHVYIFLIAQTGIPQDYSLPPRGPLLLILPAFLFTGIFIYQNRNRDWLANIPIYWPIFYQTFRILLETMFVFSVARGVLHPNMTIEGYNYDMIFAISAPFIGWGLIRGTDVARRRAAGFHEAGIAVRERHEVQSAAECTCPEVAPAVFIQAPHMVAADAAGLFGIMQEAPESRLLLPVFPVAGRGSARHSNSRSRGGLCGLRRC